MNTYPTIRMIIGGQTLEFTRDNIIYADVFEEINQLSTELPANTLEFKVHTQDESFSMFAGDYFEQLYKRLPIMVYEYLEGAQTFIGKFYLDEWDNVSEQEFTFKALDIIGVMGQMDFDGRFWETPTALNAILSQLLDSIGVSYTLDQDLAEIVLSGWIAPGDYRKALQQVCFAAGTTVSTARSEDINIIPVRLPQYLFDRKVTDEMRIVAQRVRLLPIVTKIELVSHNYSAGAQEESVFKDVLEAGSHKIVFDKPYYDISVNGPGYAPFAMATEDGNYIATENGDYIEVGGEYQIGPNALYLQLSEPGEVEVTGYPWVDSRRAFTFSEQNIGRNETTNSLLVDDATMVNLSNAQDILDGLRDFYRLRFTQEMTLLPSNIHPGEHVITNAFYNNRVLGAVEKISLNLTAGYLAKVGVRGLNPQYIQPVDDPERRARTGVAVCGASLQDQNLYRRYAHG